MKLRGSSIVRLIPMCGGGATGRRKGVKILWAARPVPVRFRPPAPTFPGSYDGLAVGAFENLVPPDPQITEKSSL